MPRIHKNFAEFGSDAQQMLIDQIQTIDLEKIGPKSIAHVGKTLIALIKQSHQLQEETNEETRDNWIAIRELSHIILVEILDKYKELSVTQEIPEWERANVMGVLMEITKVCHAEAKRDALAEINSGSVIDESTLDEILGL
jgi:predicted transport protein